MLLLQHGSSPHQTFSHQRHLPLTNIPLSFKPAPKFFGGDLLPNSLLSSTCLLLPHKYSLRGAPIYIASASKESLFPNLYKAYIRPVLSYHGARAQPGRLRGVKPPPPPLARSKLRKNIKSFNF